jgi:hypothetical protein
MPRNGSGVYSPTAGIPVVSGTTISSTAVNNVLDDLGDEITASLPVSGVAPMTGVLRVTAGTVGAPGLVIVGDTNTGIYAPGADQLSIATGGVNALTVSATQTTTWAGVATFQAKAVGKAFDVDAITDVASASTCDIGAAATSEVNITGTTTITSFGTSNAGIRRRGRFAGALTIAHNGTSLILPGAANITTAANDAFEAVSLGSGNWQVTHYQRAAFGPGDGVRALLASGVATSVATIDLALGSTYKVFDLEIDAFYPATNAQALFLRVSDDNGATYETTNYAWQYIYNTSAAPAPQGNNSAAAGVTSGFTLGGSQSNSTTLYNSTLRMRITIPQASLTYTVVDWSTVHVTSGPDLLFLDGGGHCQYAATHIRLLYGSGNIARCNYRLYGVSA